MGKYRGHPLAGKKVRLHALVLTGQKVGGVSCLPVWQSPFAGPAASCCCPTLPKPVITSSAINCAPSLGNLSHSAQPALWLGIVRRPLG
jgi:hypothetical protein